MSSATSTSPGISQLLDDRYRVEGPIARGGMATVYRGHDERLDRVVALKIMHPHLAMDEDFRRRFAREARSAARLAHRNVVGVFDQGEDGENIYLAMELIDGPTLRTRIIEHGRLTVRESLDITEQVLEALVAAHEAGIVHRDIKPENILIDAAGVVKVADFGLARAIGTSHSSASATLLGTVAYISPEVVTRGHCDERSDLYSLGVVLFEMLTGRQPFVGEQPVHIAFQHVHEDIPAPSSLVNGVPRELDSLVTWIAARKVEQRPLGARELLRAVRELQHSLPQAVQDARPLERSGTDTGDIPQLTTPLEDAVAELRTGPRGFPAALLSGADHPDATPGAAEEYAPSSDQGPSAQSASAAATDSADADHPAANEDTRGAEDAASDPTTVALPPVRARHGRHLPQRARRRSRPFAALAALSVIAALGTGAWTGADWYYGIGPGADRTVPVLAGTQLSDAEAALQAADLTISTREQFDADVPAGHVISSSYTSGDVVKKGTPIEVVVSRGEQLFDVPDLVDMSVEDASTQLAAIGLELQEDDRAYSETVPEGIVISQTSSAAALPAGGVVHVVVSQGREPIAIPDQRGRDGGAARTALEDAGFTVSTSKAHSGTVPAGNVISQTPASGTGYRGDGVQLVTSLGPEMVKVPDVFQRPEAEAKSTLESAGFAVTVEHDRGEPVFGLVYQQSAAAGTELAKGSTITITVF